MPIEVARELCGALSVHEQGLTVTTSKFTRDATAEATAPGRAHIGLVNGDTLIDPRLRTFSLGVPGAVDADCRKGTQGWETTDVVFLADDLGAWLVGLLADAGRKKLTTLVLGTDQERALRQAATAAVQLTARELDPSGGDQAGQLAMVMSEVFSEPTPDEPLARQATLLEGLQTGIVQKLAPLGDVGLTGTGQSSSELLGVPTTVLAERLADYLVREIMLRGSRGGPLAPLADQLNHDVTHLQGQRLEGMLARLANEVQDALAQAARTWSNAMTNQPVRLLPRPAFLVGREELLVDLDTRLTGGDGQGP